MNALQPETPVADTPEERIGKYRVHPAASMFPLLEGDEYENLRGSIETYGQFKPIVVQGDLLLDGRNRLKACLELEVEPKVEQYAGSLDPVDYILIANVDRRHLTPDVRSAICFKIRAWRIEQRNAEKKATGKSADGSAGGRGHKKRPSTGANLDTKSDPGLPKRDLTEKNANSTVGQIADAARVSHHKAAQTVAVGKAAPDLLDQVVKGEVKLKDAHAKVKATKAAVKAPPQRAEPHQSEEPFDADRVYRTIEAMIENCPKKHLAGFMKRLYSATEPSLWQWLKPDDVLIVNNQTAFIANLGRRREKGSNHKWPFGAGELIMRAVECLISELSIGQRAELRKKEW
jgi:hypothetical protein